MRLWLLWLGDVQHRWLSLPKHLDCVASGWTPSKHNLKGPVPDYLESPNSWGSSKTAHQKRIDVWQLVPNGMPAKRYAQPPPQNSSIVGEKLQKKSLQGVDRSLFTRSLVKSCGISPSSTPLGDAFDTGTWDLVTQEGTWMLDLKLRRASF